MLIKFVIILVFASICAAKVSFEGYSHSILFLTIDYYIHPLDTD